MDFQDFLRNKFIPVEKLYEFVKYLHSSGLNISEYIEKNKIECNRSKLIEYMYEVQAGSYIELDRCHNLPKLNYCIFTAKCISTYGDNPKSVLDCGTGELTTLLGIHDYLPRSITNIYATDISFSRLYLGSRYWMESKKQIPKLFCSGMNALPFADNSFDLIITSHSIESNGSSAIEILNEFLRVAKKVIAIEPSYEKNSAEGRKRMEKLGYISEMSDVVLRSTGILECVVPFPEDAITNPLNPSCCYVIKKGGVTSIKREKIFTYPGTSSPLHSVNGGFFSPQYDSLFPVFSEIPILRLDAIVRSANHYA